MRLRIFSRLILGYLSIALLVLAVSIYMIFRLVQFESTTRLILRVDHRVEDLEKKLTDSLLSQMRYEKKYMVTRDVALYAQFLAARDEFNRYLGEVLTVPDPSSPQDLLNKLKADHQTYQNLIEEEAGYVWANRPYSSARYREEKDKIFDQMLEELQTLVAYYRQNTLKKTVQLEEAGVSARQVTMVIVAVALLAVLLLSLGITSSITHPISLLVGKTREIARGNLENSLAISGPPEIKELGESLNSMCVQLRAIDKMKTDFFSTVSHELRTPLTSIKEGTSLLLDGVGGEITEKQKKLLKIIAGESKRLIELVNSSLDLSKMEAGMTVLNFTKEDLAPLIQKAASEIEPLAMGKKIHLRVESHDRLPLMKMDRERILQVLRNILGNAVKFTFEEGEVKISAHSENGKVKVAIKDSGPGIPEENLKTIFEKFHQVPLKGLEHKGGTGLGLAIVKQVITAHGGKVWAESEPGQGSTFIFVLPV